LLPYRAEPIALLICDLAITKTVATKVMK
jgi:hypothetical protein